MDNRQYAKEFIEYLWNNGDETVLGSYLHPDFKMHRPLADRFGTDREAFRSWFRYVKEFSPDMTFSPVDSYDCNGAVIVTWRAKGTHVGEFRGIQGTNKRFSTEGLFIFKMKDGKFIYSRMEWDVLGFLDQIGYTDRGNLKAVA